VKAAPFAVIALAGAVAAGCAGNPGTPTSPGTTTASSASLAVPAVSNPLDASRFGDAPCGLIPEQQARGLGLPFAREERTGSRVACTWHADQTNPSPVDALTVTVQTDSGLAAIARQCRGRTECDSWTMATITGYPAIRANAQLESKYGLCRLFVGIADNAAILITDGDLDAIRKGATQGDAGGPRCDRADHAATIALQTLKAAR
jgi:hypothetical protein